jgi:hypothetical protein
MNNPTTNANLSIDPSTPFSAHTFYAVLRAKGSDPTVRNGGLHVLLNEGPTGVGLWAAKGDPSGSVRMDYARAAWAKRTSDDEIVLLGVRQ